MGSRKHPASVKHADIRAAVFRVALDPNSDADYYGVAGLVQALQDLPPEGGTIWVGEGTFPIASTIALPDKPVRIIGAGMGATIFDLGDNGIALFEITYERPYSFEEFTILGDSSVGGQIGFRFMTAYGSQETVVRRVSTVTDDYDATRLINTLFHVVPDGFAWITAESLNLVVTDLYLDGNADLDMYSCVDLADVGGGFANGSITTLWLYGCILTIDTDSEVFTLDAVYTLFFGSAPTYMFKVKGYVNLYGCDFLPVSVDRCLEILAAPNPLANVVGCYFSNWTSEAIRLARSNAYIAGNRNCRVTETGTANGNRYWSNEGFTGSTLIGASSSVDGGFVRTVSSNVTLDDSYRTVLVDASGGARTVTLPAASSCKHRQYTIKKIDSSTNAVTIAAVGTDLIDGAATLVIGSQYTSRTIVSNGAAWWVV